MIEKNVVLPDCRMFLVLGAKTALARIPCSPWVHIKGLAPLCLCCVLILALFSGFPVQSIKSSLQWHIAGNLGIYIHYFVYVMLLMYDPLYFYMLGNTLFDSILTLELTSIPNQVRNMSMLCVCKLNPVWYYPTLLAMCPHSGSLLLFYLET